MRDHHASAWPELFKPEMAGFWVGLGVAHIEYGRRAFHETATTPSSDLVSRLISDAIDPGLRFSGTKASPLKQRAAEGKKIARHARELSTLIRPRDTPAWRPGFGADDPLFKSLTHAMRDRLQSKVDAGARNGIWSPERKHAYGQAMYDATLMITAMLDAMADAADRWRVTPPVMTQVSGDRGVRRYMLGKLALFMVAFTGERRPALELQAARPFFANLDELNPEEPDSWLSSTQKRQVADALAGQQELVCWHADPANAETIKEWQAKGWR